MKREYISPKAELVMPCQSLMQDNNPGVDNHSGNNSGEVRSKGSDWEDFGDDVEGQAENIWGD